MSRDPKDPWWWDAACHGMAPMFDHVVGERSGGHVPDALLKADAKRYEAAARVCAGCPVRAQCDADTQVGRDEGIRAGRLLPPVNWKTRKAANAA